jgi:DNA-binding transcriptional ArsR family regulator
MSSSEFSNRAEKASAEADRLEALKAILSEPRRRIMEVLYRGPANSGLIAESSGLSRSLVNHHLQVLAKRGLVRQVGDRPIRYYELTTNGRALLESVRREQSVAEVAGVKGRDLRTYLYMATLAALTGIFLYNCVSEGPQPLWALGFLILASPFAYATVKGLMQRRGEH